MHNSLETYLTIPKEVTSFKTPMTEIEFEQLAIYKTLRQVVGEHWSAWKTSHPFCEACAGYKEPHAHN